MKKMKKALAAMMAATMVMSANMTAWAANEVDTNKDMTTITITKDYRVTDTENLGHNPAETFKFTIAGVSVTDANSYVNVGNMPIPTIGEVAYADGEAGVEGKMSKNIAVILPEYTSVGIYTYKINEVVGDTAGVTYYGEDIKLVVTVQQGDDGKIRVAAVHTEAPEEQTKTDNFPNEYSAGSLAVKKVVTGNMGDQKQMFKVNVIFHAPEGKTVNGTIDYTTPDGWNLKVYPDDARWETKKGVEVEVFLKHNDTVTFTNIPAGVTYDVVEENYTANAEEEANRLGYDPAKYSETDKNEENGTDGSGTISVVTNEQGAKVVDADLVTITNNKGVEVDTGINLDSMPYIILLAVAAMGIFTVVAKKRDEDLF